MNNKNTLVISMLITATVIGFVETGVIQFNKESIHAQQEIRNLVLEKNGERVTIPIADWIVSVNAAYPDIYFAGDLLGATSDGIMIHDSKTNLDVNIPAIEIGVLYHGQYKVTGKYVKKGMKVSGLISLGLGTVAGIAAWSETGDISNLGCGLLLGFVGGIFNVPSGALIGFISAKVAEGKAMEYIIGTDEWKIVLE